MKNVWVKQKKNKKKITHTHTHTHTNEIKIASCQTQKKNKNGSKVKKKHKKTQKQKHDYRSDCKAATFTGDCYINDCHENRIFKTKTGDALETFVNSFKIFVDLQVYDSSNNLIGYMESTNFIDNNVALKNTNQTTVATLHRDKLTIDGMFLCECVM